jgi:hypothetical protein
MWNEASTSCHNPVSRSASIGSSSRTSSPGSSPRRLTVTASLIKRAVYTGVRKAELLTLTWADVDSRARVIRVRGKLDRATMARKATPTTDAGSRDVVLAPSLGADLRRHCLASPFSQDSDLVFATARAVRPAGQTSTAADCTRRATTRSFASRIRSGMTCDIPCLASLLVARGPTWSSLRVDGPPHPRRDAGRVFGPRRTPRARGPLPRPARRRRDGVRSRYPLLTGSGSQQ